MDNDAKVIWITGLSGSGKSTIARKIQELLQLKGVKSIVIDGDQIRYVVNDNTCGYDKESRIINAFRICRLAKLIVDQGFIVIVATISLYHVIHEWNKDNLSGYHEVFLDVNIETLKKRDTKGLYKKADSGAIDNVAGVHLDIEAPKSRIWL
jgi:adenylylsulfate kinase